MSRDGGSSEKMNPASDPPKAGPPDSFARIFLGGLEKYEANATRSVGSATEEAAANLGQKTQRARPMAGLELRANRAILETVAITIAIPTLGYIVDRTDPFFLKTRFAWILFAPLLVSLRHGFTLGFGSAVLLDAALVVSWRMQLVPFERFPGAPLVGLIALAMIVGQFSDVWKREAVRLDAGIKVLRRQVNELERSRFLLELSHDRLDAQVGRATNSLREAMTAVRELAAEAPATSYSALGAAMMEVFAAYCMVEVGELYVVDKERLGERVAALGRPAQLDPQDPLLLRALKKGQLTFVPASSSIDRDPILQRSVLLAAVPFVDTSGRVTAVLCVQAMPFISFDRNNLQAMASLAGYFADIVAYGGQASDAERASKEIFRVRLLRALRDLKERSIPSVVTALYIQRGAAVGDLVDALLGGALRELEFPYVATDGLGNRLVYVLLPMADDAAGRALKSRFEAIVARNLHLSLEAAGARYFHHVLQPTDTVEGIFRLFDGKTLQNEAAPVEIGQRA